LPFDPVPAQAGAFECVLDEVGRGVRIAGEGVGEAEERGQPGAHECVEPVSLVHCGPPSEQDDRYTRHARERLPVGGGT
jgi:hypothetical protein